VHIYRNQRNTIYANMQRSEVLISFVNYKIVSRCSVLYPLLISVAEIDFVSAITDHEDNRECNITQNVTENKCSLYEAGLRTSFHFIIFTGLIYLMR
jgi:hypothetical protein